MKPVTARQVKSFAKNNDVLRRYAKQCERRWDSHRYYDKIGRNPTVKHESGWHTDLTTYQRNVLYGEAHDVFNSRFPSLPDSQLFLSFTDPMGIYTFRGTLRFNILGSAVIRIDGCWIEDIDGDKRLFTRLPFTDGEYEFTLNYDGVLSVEAASDYARRKFMDKYLYKQGRWQTLQLSYRWSKADVIRNYKYNIENFKPKYWSAYDESEMLAWLKRHKNLIDYDGLRLDIGTVVRFFRKHPGFTKPTKLAKYDHSWIFDFDGDVDEIESEYYNSLEDNTFYI